MDRSKVQAFFDNRAPSWDQAETCPIERRRALLAQLHIRPDSRVLDVACGTGVMTALLHEVTNAPVVGVDISPNMIAIAREKYAEYGWATFLAGDFVAMQADNEYDFVLIYNAYPHFDDPAALAAGIARVLRPAGRFAILHSLSRRQLDMHHAHCMDVSRNIQAPQVECKYFERLFDIEQASEGEDYYLIVGAKRS